MGSAASDTSDDDMHSMINTKENIDVPKPDVRTNDFGRRKVSETGPSATYWNSLLSQGQARNAQLLLPKGHTGPSAPGVRDRMKHPKLVGADIYVVRLAKETHASELGMDHVGEETRQEELTGDEETDTLSISSVLGESTGSLYDELKCRGKDSGPKTSKLRSRQQIRVVAESRPCYRCVSYMHSVGIKRVFWTTSEGKWEGAKVQEMIDQLDGAMASADTSLGSTIPDVFVTKHEVLLLRRLMVNEGQLK